MSLIHQVDNAAMASGDTHGEDWVEEMAVELVFEREGDLVLKSADGGVKGLIDKVVDAVKGAASQVKDSSFGQWLRGNPGEDDDDWSLPSDADLDDIPNEPGGGKASSGCSYPNTLNDGVDRNHIADAYCKDLRGERWSGIYECFRGDECCTPMCWERDISWIDAGLEEWNKIPMGGG